MIKHIIITGSFDKRILIYQLPIYYPAELIRNDKTLEDMNKENDNLKSSNILGNDEILPTKDKDFNYDENVLIKKNNNKVESLLESKNLLINRREKRVLNEEEKNCDDIQGWDI